MASAQESPSKKRVAWTSDLNGQVSSLENRLQHDVFRIPTNNWTIQLFMALINTLDSNVINYAKIAEQLGEGKESSWYDVHSTRPSVSYADSANMTNNFHETGFTERTVYKRFYDIKKRGASFEISISKKANDAITTPKKRKVASDAEGDLWIPPRKSKRAVLQRDRMGSFGFFLNSFVSLEWF